jgi:hypothetical protein
MSVILFSVHDVYADMATAYEGLKHPLHETANDEQRFYKALRRMYYANVAAYLCQYHGDKPLSEQELTSIDTVQHIAARKAPLSVTECARMYLHAWGALKYNTVTNDGEVYRAEDSYALLESLGESTSRLALGA